MHNMNKVAAYNGRKVNPYIHAFFALNFIISLLHKWCHRLRKSKYINPSKNIEYLF